MNKTRLRSLEVNIASTPRCSTARDTSYESLLEKLSGVADGIESFTINYANKAYINPRAGLSECRRASSLRGFPRLRKLVLPQQALITCNY